MNAVDVRVRMAKIEHHGEDFTTLDFMTWLLSLDGDVDEALRGEIERALELCEGHYSRVSWGTTLMDPLAILLIGFQQGATFAAAALGRQTREEEKQ